jgi:YfiH family protein
MRGALRPTFQDAGDGTWRVVFARSAHVQAAVGERSLPVEQAVARFKPPIAAVQAEQVHGAGIAAVESPSAAGSTIAGCDALVTRMMRLALVIRSADCLPILVSDPVRRIIAAAHAGWRGLAAELPIRLVYFLVHFYRCRPSDLQAAIGPGIRACCYAVGPEFGKRFGRFVKESHSKRFCDLPAIAADQLCRAGVSPERIGDSFHCTACDAKRWFSLRREGPQTGRLASWIILTS